MGVTFITPQDVTPFVTGLWRDVDVSAYVPVGTTLALFHFVNTSTAITFAVRKNGSTDNRLDTGADGCHVWGAIGVDANRVFEAYFSSVTNAKLYLVGYVDSDGVAFTNGVSKTMGFGTWADINISADTGADTAVLAFFEITGTGGSERGIGFRKNGSTDARIINTLSPCFAVVGLDGSEICEAYRNGTASAYLTGYLTAGVAMYTNGLDRSLSSTGAWTDLTALPVAARGGIYEVVHNSSLYANFGLRKNGSSEDIFQGGNSRHAWALIEADASQLIEGKIDNTAADFYEMGMFGIVETIADLAGSVSTVTDLRQMLEALSTTIASQDSVAHVQTYLETLRTDIASIASVTDIKTHVEAVTDLAGSVSSVTDLKPLLETITGTITSLASVADALQAIDLIIDAAQSAASVADVQAYVETLSTTITSSASLADAQAFLEDLRTDIAAAASVTDIQPFLEVVTDTATSVASVTDVAALLETITTVAASAASVTDLAAYPETLTTLAQSAASVTDALRFAETLATVATSEASVTDHATVYEVIRAAAASISSAADLLYMLDNVEIMILSHASVTDIVTYIDTVTVTGVASAIVAEEYIWRYIRRSAVGSRAFHSSSEFRVMEAASPSRSFAASVNPRVFSSAGSAEIILLGSGGRMIELPSKTSFEEFFQVHDFAPWLASGETVSSVTVTASDNADGTDVSASMISNAAPYESTKVRFMVKAGTSRHTYTLKAQVITSNGQKFEDRLELGGAMMASFNEVLDSIVSALKSSTSLNTYTRSAWHKSLSVKRVFKQRVKISTDELPLIMITRPSLTKQFLTGARDGIHIVSLYCGFLEQDHEKAQSELIGFEEAMDDALLAFEPETVGAKNVIPGDSANDEGLYHPVYFFVMNVVIHHRR